MSSSANVSLANHPFRVFVVDDNAAIASSLAMILRLQEGLDVVSFTNPVEALRVSQSDPPDLLISDMYMPDLSGIELAESVLGQSPQCKVILLSGDTLSSVGSRLPDSRGEDFEVLLKPIHPADLIGRVQRMSATAAQQLTARVA